MKTLARAAIIAALVSTAGMAAQAAHAQVAQPTPVAAESLFRATTLNLSAYGETRVAPDMATITLGVQTQGKTAVEAMRQNAAQMTRVVSSLKAQGIAEKDIQTSNLSLNAQYKYEDNQPPVLIGYQASNNVTIRVLDIARLGQAIDAVVGAGANQIHGIGFGLQNPQAAEDAARRAAVQALTAKANLYATATSHRVGRLVNLSEGGGYTPQPPMPMVMSMAKREAFDSTPVAGGELVVRIDVTGLYELTK